MAVFDTTNAQPIYNSAGILVGHIRKHTEELWLPLDIKGENITGPTYKKDAENIVIHAAAGIV